MVMAMNCSKTYPRRAFGRRSASAQRPETQKENQADHSPERAAEGCEAATNANNGLWRFNRQIEKPRKATAREHRPCPQKTAVAQ